MSLLSVQNLKVVRVNRSVVDSVSFDLASGEILGLIGPNGAGKTSLLRALIGAIPAEGQIALSAKPLETFSVRERAAQISYLQQGQQCHWAINVANLVGLGRLPRRSPFQAAGAADYQAIEATLADLQLTDFAERSIQTLSGGEKARAFLARALVSEPTLLLADEPVAALDPGQQLLVMQQMRRRADAGLAVIIVLHDLSLAAQFCDRLLLIHQGRARLCGEPRQVLKSQEIEEAYDVAFSLGEIAGALNVQAQPR